MLLYQLNEKNKKWEESEVMRGKGREKNYSFILSCSLLLHHKVFWFRPSPTAQWVMTSLRSKQTPLETSPLLSESSHTPFRESGSLHSQEEEKKVFFLFLLWCSPVSKKAEDQQEAHTSEFQTTKNLLDESWWRKNGSHYEVFFFKKEPVAFPISDCSRSISGARYSGAELNDYKSKIVPITPKRKFRQVFLIFTYNY